MTEVELKEALGLEAMTRPARIHASAKKLVAQPPATPNLIKA
jgi:hypothetical protein